MVTQPFEHAVFLERMKAMRYDDGADEGSRRSVLRELGIEAARVLGSIPRLPGSLSTDAAGPDTLVHLRLVLTPSELASLPFELAKVPIGPNNCTEAWLSLQARSPVVITRRTRNVSSLGVRWPLRPRILFVSADPDDVPFERHRSELLDALAPFRMPGRDEPKLSGDGRREQFGKLLTILKDARFEDVVAECAAHHYTHVHILAHGDEDRSSVHTTYGLVLDGTLISAERLASAFSSICDHAIRRPAVVTLATCESGNPGSVLVPGGSIAHVLHQAGIALVLASQVPLSKDGSVLVVREFYRGLLWAENPWVLLHRIRSTLHGLLGAASHDWASLVVYEALPADLVDQLEEARYQQAKAANNVSFERIDRAVEAAGAYGDHRAALEESLTRLPAQGRFAMESLGLRASSLKRLAQAEFRIALQPGCESPVQHALESAKHLHQALHHYELSVTGFMVDTGKPVQRVASLHWVLVQQLCLSAVLGKGAPEGTRETARMSALAYLEHPDPAEQAWAHGSLAEMALLALDNVQASSPRDAEFKRLRDEAHRHVRELIRLARRLDQPFIIESTLRQFRRYVDWWSTSLLKNVVISLDLDDRGNSGEAIDSAWLKRESGWVANGMAEVARELAEALDEKGAADRTAKAASRRYPTVAKAATAAAPPASATSSVTATSVPLPAQATSRITTLGVTGQTGRDVGTGAAEAVLNIEMLPAAHGDCLWIEYGSEGKISRVLVDGGTPETFEPWIKPRIEKLAKDDRHFELLVLTHIDADHVGGGIPFIRAASELGVTVGDVWFNGWKHIKQYGFLGAKQGEVFSGLLETNRWPWNAWMKGKAIVLTESELPSCTLPGGLVLTLLSPTPNKLKALAIKWKKEITALGLEPGQGDQFLARTTVTTSTDVPALAASPFSSDSAENNGSSITLLAEFGGKSVLLGADCHAPLLAESLKTLLKARGLKKLPLSAFKVPHHGSRNNLDETVMSLIDCRNYLISTSGKVFQHPDREAIARIIHFGGRSPQLMFNYASKVNEVWARRDLQQQYGYGAVYPEPGHDGLLVQL